jgi:hypothetical protein
VFEPDFVTTNGPAWLEPFAVLRVAPEGALHVKAKGMKNDWLDPKLAKAEPRFKGTRVLSFRRAGIPQARAARRRGPVTTKPDERLGVALLAARVISERLPAKPPWTSQDTGWSILDAGEARLANRYSLQSSSGIVLEGDRFEQSGVGPAAAGDVRSTGCRPGIRTGSEDLHA